ncbi:MAG: stage VI sporulation protein F [Bacilli bacterium]|nr:stage VI sporulation protein F [Bacilli bacterium]
MDLRFSDNFFKRVESKTNVGKQTILDLAAKLQQGDLKNEQTLREVIQELGQMTGRDVSKDKEDKIIEAVVNDKVPKDIDKMI